MDSRYCFEFVAGVEVVVAVAVELVADCLAFVDSVGGTG